MTALKYCLALAFSLLAIPVQGTATKGHEWVAIDGFEPGARTAYDRTSVSRGNSEVVTLVLRQHSPQENALGLPSYYHVIFDCSTDLIRISAGMPSLSQNFVFLKEAEFIAGHHLEQLFEQICFSSSEGMTTVQQGKADLGVSVVTLTDDLGGSFLPVIGVRVELLVKGSAADLAGIRVGDHIIGYGNAPIVSAAHLEGLLAVAAVGDTVQILLSRNGSRQAVDAVLQAYPFSEESAIANNQAGGEPIFDEAPIISRSQAVRYDSGISAGLRT